MASPLGVRAHSTRRMASFKALTKGAPLHEVRAAAGWLSPHTFLKCYT